MIAFHTQPKSTSNFTTKLALYAHVFLIFLLGIRAVYQIYLPSIVNQILVLATIIPAVFGWWVVILYKGNRKWFPQGVWKGYFIFYLVWIFGMALYGAVNGNYYKLIILDAVPLLLIAQGFVLASEESFWEDMKWLVLIITVLALLVGFTNLRTEVIDNRALLGEQAGYRAQSLFYLLPLWFVYASYGRNLTYQACLTFAIIAVIAFQLVFLKRAPLVYFGLFVMIALFIGVRQGKFITLSVVAASVFFGLVLVVTILPWQTIMENMESRFIGKKQEGLLDTLTTRNDRLYELQFLLKDLRPHEYLIGRGLGGVFSGIEMMDFRSYVTDDGVDLGKESTHIGYGTYLLKGGFLYLFISFIPALILVSRILLLGRQSVYTKAAIWFCLVQLFSFMIEGAPSVSTQFLALAFGVALGTLGLPDARKNAMRLRLPQHPQRGFPRRARPERIAPMHAK